MTAFEELYHTYFNDVYLYILRLSGDEHIAEEITSDTFFRAMRAMDHFRGDCDVRVWLCQIAKNCYHTYLKKQSCTESLDTEPWQKAQNVFPIGSRIGMKPCVYKRYCTRFPSPIRKFSCGVCMRR